MSTLTLRAIDDDYYFLSFNPSGESWSSLRPEFQMATSTFCHGPPKGQNTIFLTSNDDKKTWENQTFNPPLVFQITIGNNTQQVYIPMCPIEYTQQTLASEINSQISILGPMFSGISFVFDKVFKIVNTGPMTRFFFNSVLASSLGFSENVSVQASTTLSGVPSAFQLYYVPKSVNSIKIATTKNYKGQYYLALEDCNIRIKSNFDSVDMNQQLSPIVSYSKELVSQTISVNSNVLSIPNGYYTISSLVIYLNKLLQDSGYQLTLSFDTTLNEFTFTNISGLAYNVSISVDLSEMIGMPLSFLVPPSTLLNTISSQFKASKLGDIGIRVYENGQSRVEVFEKKQYTPQTLVSFLKNVNVLKNVDMGCLNNTFTMTNKSKHQIDIELSTNLKEYLGLEDNIVRLGPNASGTFVGSPVNFVVAPNKKPLVFEDTCIFCQVEIYSSAEQGNLNMQNFNKGVIINYKNESTVENYPFETRKILFPIMMRRDIPPWNGLQLNMSTSVLPNPSVYPNARTTGFSSESKSKSVYLIPLGSNEQFKVTFWRSNGEKLPMATDMNMLNPNDHTCFATVAEAEAFYKTLDSGWFISQASLMLRVSNARPEYL